jgi:hypothetical protein
LRRFSLFLYLLITVPVLGTDLSGTVCPTSGATFGDLLFSNGPFRFGCDVGPLNYTFTSFRRTDAPSGSIAASDVDVFFSDTPGTLGVQFFSDRFTSVNFVTPETYLLSYIVDPPPIIVGESLELLFEQTFAAAFLSEFTFQVAQDIVNSIDVTQRLCVDQFFVDQEDPTSLCGFSRFGPTTNPLIQSVNLNSPASSLTFNAVPLVSVQLLITLSGDLSGTGLAGVGSRPTVLDSTVPEPYSVGLIGGGLAILGLVGRYRRRRAP